MNPVKAALVGVYSRTLFGPSPHSDAEYGAPVAYDTIGNAVISQALRAGDPCLVARFGSTELMVIAYRERWRRGPVRVPYPTRVGETASVASGIHPTDDRSLDAFCDTMLAAAAQVDVLGVWHNPSEARIVRTNAPRARLVHLDALNPVCYREPWSRELAGRKVLVIHPFAESVQRQYRERRQLLFSDPEVLPQFDLSTYAPVQSVGGNESVHGSWHAALGSMCEDISGLDFDVAVIGAGAYGMPLGAHIKSMGRQAVHLGGNTQLLFGIRGRRWEVESPDIARLFNEHWVRPRGDETPPGAEKVEGGCYW